METVLTEDDDEFFYHQEEEEQEEEEERQEEQEQESCRTFWKGLFHFMGPGVLVSLAFLDPGNLEGDLQSGAYTDFSLLWVLFWSTVAGYLLQMLSCKLGVVYGKDLAMVCNEEFGYKTSRILWFSTELAIIGSDVQEVVGSAIAFKILFNLPLFVGCILTVLDTFIFLSLHSFGMKKLQAFLGVLVFTMACMFLINAVNSSISLDQFATGTLIPELRTYAYTQAVSIIGAVIMPHNLFLHSALVKENGHYGDEDESTNERFETRRRFPSMEENSSYRLMRIRRALKFNYLESAVFLSASFFINAAVMATFATQFFDEQCASVHSTDNSMMKGPFASLPSSSEEKCEVHIDGLCCGYIGLEDTGDALEHTLGSNAKIYWAIGLLAAGQASTITGTYAGQFVLEGFFNLRVSPLKRLLITRGIALVPALIIAFVSLHGFADRADEWLNVLQSFQLPFALFPILKFTSNPRIMSEEFVNSTPTKMVCWILGIVLVAINSYSAFHYVLVENDLTSNAGAFVCVVLFCLLYLFFLCTVLQEEIRFTLYKIIEVSNRKRRQLQGCFVNCKKEDQYGLNDEMERRLLSSGAQQHEGAENIEHLWESNSNATE